MIIKEQIEEILLTDYQYVDCYTVQKLLDLFAVSGRSEQLVCDCGKDKRTKYELNIGRCDYCLKDIAN